MNARVDPRRPEADARGVHRLRRASWTRPAARRWALALSSAVFSVSCAAAVESEEDDAAPPIPSMPAPSGFVPPPTVDAAGGGDPPVRLDAQVPGTQPATQPPTQPPGQCAPNLCLQCDAAGRAVIPDDDPACPALDCASLDTFALTVVDGIAVCERQVHLPSGHRCDGPGRCRMVPDVLTCGDVRPVEQARSSSACEIISGCEGATPPTLGPAPAGEPCGDAGLCRANGLCDTTVGDACPRFEGAQICDAGVHVNGEQYCDIAAAGATCLAACQTYGRPCLAAYVSVPEAPCRQGEATGCLAEGAHLRCRCQNR